MRRPLRLSLALTVLVALAGFSGASADEPPRLQTALAVISAGGGAEHFKTTTLLEVLAGPAAGAEATNVTKRFGAQDVKGIVATFDFLIADVVRAGNAHTIVFPAAPAPDPKDGRALARALYAAGTDKSGRFDVERMLDGLLTHRLRTAIMRDADAKYGVAAVAKWRDAVQLVMSDLKDLHSL